MLIDTGLVREPATRQSTGIPVTIREIATGEIPIDTLCPQCEVIVYCWLFALLTV